MDLTEKTTEQLQKELKSIKAVSSVLIGVLIVLVSVNIYGLATNENKVTFLALMVVAFACGATLIPQFSTIKKIKAELTNRGIEA